jgi:hypothetical protein
MEEGEEDDHEGPGPITSRRPWQPGTLMSKISRTVRGGEEFARNVRKGCRTLDEEDFLSFPSGTWGPYVDTLVGLLWTSDQPIARPLPTHNTERLGQTSLP